jgi:6-pyruvoyltetrahydropterin/6-carboxytetrahydropterin synthase
LAVRNKEVKNMYRLRVQTDLEAAHFLEGYKGRCANLHGHSWVVEVFVVGSDLDKVGMLVDFGNIKGELTKVVDRLDHTLLNDIKEIGNPTSENLAKYIYDFMGFMVPALPSGVELEKVRIWETPRAWCEYCGEMRKV